MSRKAYATSAVKAKGAMPLRCAMPRVSGACDFFLQAELLLLDRLDSPGIRERPRYFLSQAGLKPGMLGVECFEV
jgi:hypothetical protein